LRLFELANKDAAADNVGNHPNSFFNSAVAADKAMKEKEKK
jgi:hypothetical protein